MQVMIMNNDTGCLQQRHRVKDRSIRVINMIGKDEKPASISVAGQFIKEMLRYREALDKPADLKDNESFFFSLSGKKCIGSRQMLHNIFKVFISEVVDSLYKKNNPATAKRIEASSVRWLRHSFVTLGLDQQFPLILISH